MWRWSTAPRGVVVALVAVLIVGGGLRAWRAAHPSERQSTDERAYAGLALAVAQGERYGGVSTGMSDPFHWAPGAPVALGLFAKLNPPPKGTQSTDAPIVYWAQAAFGTLLILVVFAIAAAIGGGAAGVIAAGAVALYPPLVRMSGEFLSEPLGTLLLATAVLLSLLCLRGGSRRWAIAAGLCFGFAALARADLLLAPLLVAVALAGVLAFRREARAFRTGLALACSALAVIVPWTAYASVRVGRPVPVTTADGGPLFVGTYLPGDGTRTGTTRALAGEIRRTHPTLAAVPRSELTGTQALEAVAARHPDLEPAVALRQEGLRNLSRYALGRPGDFAQMMADKTWSMWSRPSAPGGWRPSFLTEAVHLTLVLVCLAGLLAGLVRGREPALLLLLAVLVAGVGVHSVFVAAPRYAIPLLPLLVAGGAGGTMRALSLGWELPARTPAPVPAR